MNIGKQMQREKAQFNSSGIYGAVKAMLAANSEQMEGNPVTMQQTRQLLAEEPLTGELSEKNRIEILNHFKLIDYVIDNYSNELEADEIKKYHSILKNGIEVFENEYYAKIGQWKVAANTIGGIMPTVEPENVDDAVTELLIRYNFKNQQSIKSIAEFHYQFECIHPFYDGNGRVGRVIMFKECLKNNITPFIISNTARQEYGQALKEYPMNSEGLENLCSTYQKQFQKLVNEKYREAENGLEL